MQRQLSDTDGNERRIALKRRCSKSEGERGLISCEIRSEENSLGWYLKNATEEFLVGAKIVVGIGTDETVSEKGV